MLILFPNAFYHQFQAPNAEELIAAIESDTDFDLPPWCHDQKATEENFTWQELCNVKTLGVKAEKYMPLLAPSIDQFATALNINLQYYMWNPWINKYSKGGFQETHDHARHDFVCVFFANDGDNFAKFYFHDRNGNQLSHKMQTLMNVSDRWTPDVKAGDIIFFPGHQLHAVSPHDSDIIRTSLSANFDITEQK